MNDPLGDGQDPLVKSMERANVKATWNGAIEAAARVVESGAERGEYSRADTAAAVRALAKR